jgi:hypothetical protein
MLPTIDQIQRAAYDLWERRGRTHGHDRDDWHSAERELIFRLNYRTVVRYPLRPQTPLIVGDRQTRKCRFCERTSDLACFGPPVPVVPSVLGSSSLLTAELCDECQAHARDPLNDRLAAYWRAMQNKFGTRHDQGAPREDRVLALGAFKSLAAMALLIMPETELDFFLDALEWVSNPSVDIDAPLFPGPQCRADATGPAAERYWACLARRSDDQAPLPYMLFFLAWDGVVGSLAVPLCTRDHDLEGRHVQVPELP